MSEKWSNPIGWRDGSQRQLFCTLTKSCLDIASKKGWRNFSCRLCPLRDSPELMEDWHTRSCSGAGNEIYYAAEVALGHDFED